MICIIYNVLQTMNFVNNKNNFTIQIPTNVVIDNKPKTPSILRANRRDQLKYNCIIHFFKFIFIFYNSCII